MAPSAQEKNLQWLEPFSLVGTCPLCGLSRLRLVHNMWIPAHHPAKPVAVCYPGVSGCPVQLHTQALEDGGIEAELSYLAAWERAAGSLWRSQTRTLERHLDHCQDASCDPCLERAATLRQVRQSYTAVTHPYSSPHPTKSDVGSGMEFWRDRDPFLVGTFNENSRSKHREKVERQKRLLSRPNNNNLKELERMLRVGVVTPALHSERLRYMGLRKTGLARKIIRRRNCQSYCITPLGNYALTKYWLGFDKVLRLVKETQRSTDTIILEEQYS